MASIGADPTRDPLSCNNVGFLAILQEPAGTLGGLLVTNAWGRPLEFRMTSSVQPTRIQSILYGPALPGFLAGELLGKTLVDKTTTPIRWVATDSPHALSLRQFVEYPVALVSPTPHPGTIAAGEQLLVDERFPNDVRIIADLLAASPSLVLSEPFQRIRDAVVEARKLGPMLRAA